MPPITNIAPCERGYHVCTVRQVIDGMGPALFAVEVRGDRIDEDGKSVVSEARLLRRLPWDDRAARLVAADWAEHVLPIFEAVRPDDGRVRAAIAAARAYADGEISAEELAAAWDAAWDAAVDVAGATAEVAAEVAAGAVARAAAWAVARAARDAAGTAAWASRTAARTAAGDAARNAERDWQADRLCQYLNRQVGR